MKKYLKRLIAAVTALCTCAGLVLSTSAILSPEELEQAVTPIDLTTTAVEQSSGDYLVQYVADLTMSEPFAQAVSALNTGNYLKNLRFTCVLEDDLVKQFSANASDFTFSGPGAANFIPDGSNYVSKNADGALLIRYKLNPTQVDEWPYLPAGDLLDTLMQEVTMTSIQKRITAPQLNQAKDSNGFLTTDARVEITYANGNIPIYDEPMILAAEASQVYMTIQNNPGGDPDGGSVGGSDYDIDVDDDSDDSDSVNGSVSTGLSSAVPGQIITIVVTPDDGYRLTNLFIRDKNGNIIPVAKNPDGTFSFTMPSSNVVIVPTFNLSATLPEDSGVSSLLNTDDHIAFMVGDDKGTFRPNDGITRAEVAQIFYALLKNKNVPITVSFDDVDDNAWYAKAVNTLASLGAVKGVGNGKFAPERKITRAEFATISSNFAKKMGNPFDFSDVNEKHWAYPYISTAAAHGWVNGVGDNSFQPDRGIMRAEAATIVNNMLGRIGDKDKIDAGLGRSFPDVSRSHWGWYEIGEASFSHKAVFNSTFTKEFWAD